MARLTIKNAVSFQATVSLLDRARELSLFDDWELFGDKIVPAIERLTWVEEVEDAHQFWCKIDPGTSNSETAIKRINATLDKIESIFARYSKV